ncbi:MAG: hypothetical protein F7B20_05740 [Aeropyrum sp.]|nr:hypothetical protein [Aeropyrum sp.]
MLRIKSQPVFLPDTVWESLIRIHGAVDPETGHLTCHHYPLGLAEASIGNKPVPLLALGECVFVALGSEAVSSIKALGKPGVLEGFEGDAAVISGVRTPAQPIAHLLSALRDYKLKVEILVVSSEIGGRRLDGVALKVSGDEEEWALLVFECSESEKRESDSFYI